MYIHESSLNYYIKGQKAIAFGKSLSKFLMKFGGNAFDILPRAPYHSKDSDHKINPKLKFAPEFPIECGVKYYFSDDGSYTDYQIKSNIKSISEKTCKTFKNFVLSSSKKIEYDSCRALKKVIRPDLLVDKFTKDENFKDIEVSTKFLLNHIDEKGHVYYAVANSLEGSDLEQFPKELIGHIFHYVNGDINMNLAENNAFLPSNLTGELTLESDNSVN